MEYRLPTEDPQKDQLDRQTAGVLLSEPLYGLPAAPQQTADCSQRPFFLTQITVGFFPPFLKDSNDSQGLSREKNILKDTFDITSLNCSPLENATGSSEQELTHLNNCYPRALVAFKSAHDLP